jgi:hypothetical protein
LIGPCRLLGTLGGVSGHDPIIGDPVKAGPAVRNVGPGSGFVHVRSFSASTLPHQIICLGDLIPSNISVQLRIFSYGAIRFIVRTS